MYMAGSSMCNVKALNLKRQSINNTEFNMPVTKQVHTELGTLAHRPLMILIWT